MASELPFLDQRTRTDTIRHRRKQVRARVQAKRHAPVRARRTALGLLGIALAGTIGTCLLSSKALIIRNVDVTVGSAVLPQELAAAKQAAVVDPSSNLLRVSLKDIQARLKALPWVQTASVRRVWPHGVKVQLVPRVPVALVESTDGFWEVDREGVAVRPLSLAAECPRIQITEPTACKAGRPIESPGLANALQVAGESQHGSRLPIMMVKIDPQWDMWITMKGDVKVRLGHYSGVPEKMTLLRKIYKADPNIADRVSQINLLSSEHPAVTPRQREVSSARTYNSRHDSDDGQP